MHFTSDFQENDIVFGGDKKLAKIIDEIDALFPLDKGISIQSECPIGLIGDDIERSPRRSQRDIGKPIVPVRCEGFRGVSQSLGHHIANDAIRDCVFDKAATATKLRDHALRRRHHRRLQHRRRRLGFAHPLEEMGLRVVAQWSGDATLAEMENAPKAKLNLIHCYRSMNYICRHMEEKYGIPWMEYNFFGPTKIAESLRKIAALFDDTIKASAESVIAKYQAEMDAVIAKYKPRLEGKTVMLYVGGLRPRHVIGAYEDLGMEVVGTGYEFGHNDDYERTINDMERWHGDLRRRHRLRVRGVRQDASSPTWSAPASRKSTSSRRWAFRSARCTPGTTPARTTATTASRSSPATWT